MNDAQYPIQLLACLTVLSAHMIRIWEQRYHTVDPQRTPGNRRLYSDSDIGRLNLQRDVTDGGCSIGQVVRLPMDKRARRARHPVLILATQLGSLAG